MTSKKERQVYEPWERCDLLPIPADILLSKEGFWSHLTVDSSNTKETK